MDTGKIHNNIWIVVSDAFAAFFAFVMFIVNQDAISRGFAHRLVAVRTRDMRRQKDLFSD
jgi:hypothetical protein